MCQKSLCPSWLTGSPSRASQSYLYLHACIVQSTEYRYRRTIQSILGQVFVSCPSYWTNDHSSVQSHLLHFHLHVQGPSCHGFLCDMLANEFPSFFSLVFCRSDDNNTSLEYRVSDSQSCVRASPLGRPVRQFRPITSNPSSTTLFCTSYGLLLYAVCILCCTPTSYQPSMLGYPWLRGGLIPASTQSFA